MNEIGRASRRSRDGGEAADLDPGTLDAYEKGTREIPGDVLWSLSDLLGVPIEDVDSESRLVPEAMAAGARPAPTPPDMEDRGSDTLSRRPSRDPLWRATEPRAP